MLLNPVEGIPLFVSDGELLTGRESNPERDPAVGLSDKGSAGIEPARTDKNLTIRTAQGAGLPPASPSPRLDCENNIFWRWCIFWRDQPYRAE